MRKAKLIIFFLAFLHYPIFSMENEKCDNPKERFVFFNVLGEIKALPVAAIINKDDGLLKTIITSNNEGSISTSKDALGNIMLPIHQKKLGMIPL